MRRLLLMGLVLIAWSSACIGAGHAWGYWTGGEDTAASLVQKENSEIIVQKKKVVTCLAYMNHYKDSLRVANRLRNVYGYTVPAVYDPVDSPVNAIGGDVDK